MEKMASAESDTVLSNSPGLPNLQWKGSRIQHNTKLAAGLHRDPEKVDLELIPPPWRKEAGWMGKEQVEALGKTVWSPHLEQEQGGSWSNAGWGERLPI